MVYATRVIYALAALVAFASLSLPRGANADFSGGIETFDGTVKDTDTWLETVLNPPGESITQNGEMTLTATTLSVDYTTQFTVGVGDTVNVELISVAADEGGLYLTDDSQGTALPSSFDANTLRLTYRASIPAFVASVGGAGGTLIGLGTPAPPSAGSPYTLEIERTSSTLADFRVFDNSMSLIGSTTLFLSSFPPRLAISLVSTNTTTVFDNVNAPQPCGNGFTEGIEECDDGNTVDNDGCSSECLDEICGDGMVQGPLGEECDDGNTQSEDGCSATCKLEFCGDLIVQPGLSEECEIDEQCGFGEECGPSCTCGAIVSVCGNGMVEFGEQCDDGDTQSGDGCSSDCEVEQPQNKDQRRCINELNKNFQKVAKTQGKEVCSCIKNGSKGKLGGQTIEQCLTADNAGKVSKAKAKTVSKGADRCAASTPDFAATDPNTVNRAAIDKEINLVHGIFGSDLDAVIESESLNKPAAKCQVALAKAAKKCQDTKLKEFNRCKKDGLKGKTGLPLATANQLVDACLTQGGDPSTPQPDVKGKIERACDTKIASKLNKSCTAVDLVAAFPACNTADVNELKDCVDQVVECQVCVAINTADGLNRDCDLFDDGQANGSCDDFAPECGNGAVEVGEQCDDGNTVSCDGCSEFCANEPPLVCGDGIVNGACGEGCDDAGTDPCDGCSPTCQVEVGFTCGDGTVNLTCGEECEDDGDCDFGEECDGSCQCQLIVGAVCGNTILEGGEQCDDGNTDPGDCCSPTCQFESGSTVCRTAVGPCDAEETCTGSDPNCPADQKSTGVCRAAAGLCDVPEVCDGASDTCPADDLVAGGIQCRPEAGDCDVAESCSGSDPNCPADGFESASTECRADAGQCDVSEDCTGSDPDCPSDGFESDGTGCADGDVCTAPDECSSGNCAGDSVCGNGSTEGACGEECDDGNTTNFDGCSDSCLTEIGSHKCVIDDPNEPAGFCAGGSNNGLPCTGFADCPGGVCRPVSGLIINTAAFPLTAFLTGSVDIACSAVDPNTGKAACRCLLQDLSPFEIIGIGFICISPSDPNNPCDLGEIDCDGGNGLDVDLMSDHNIGACSGNPDCDSQCVTHCAGLGKPVFDAACGGFCEGGSSDGSSCTTDAGCPDGACNGKDGLPHGNVCACSCLEIGGAASAAGGLQCNAGATILVEDAAPCNGTDVLIVIGTQCIPLTTESVSSIIDNANNSTGSELPSGGLSASGVAAVCNDLAVSTTTDMVLAGAVNFFDSTIGDLAVELIFTCR